MITTTAEGKRLTETQTQQLPWKKWGPYLSDRQWGTVREDYSPGGSAWDYFPHDQARSRAYRWGEDGILGISDDQQLLCFAIALWNGEDDILKERLFGLTGQEGNHGEDVKEYYFYLDSTPTHSYMKGLYKYPHGKFPYGKIVEETKARDRRDPEFELLETDIFAENRYFDVFVEYAKAAPEDTLIQIRVINRGTEARTLQVLPTVWFRNTWSWTTDAPKPSLKLRQTPENILIAASHPTLGQYGLYSENGGTPLFTENETNYQRLKEIPKALGDTATTPYVKDGINHAVVW
jgi:hypothetical protein